MKKKEQAIILTGITSLLILGEFIKKRQGLIENCFIRNRNFFN